MNQVPNLGIFFMFVARNYKKEKRKKEKKKRKKKKKERKEKEKKEEKIFINSNLNFQALLILSFHLCLSTESCFLCRCYS